MLPAATVIDKPAAQQKKGHTKFVFPAHMIGLLIRLPLRLKSLSMERKAISEREKSRERYYLFSVYTPGNNVNSSSNTAGERGRKK